MKTMSKKTRFWLLYHGGLLIFSFVVASIMKYSQTGDPFHETLLVPMFSIFAMSAGIGYLAIFMVNRAKRYSQDQLRRKLLPYLIVFYIMAGLIANLSVTAGVFVWYLINGIDLSGFWTHLFSMELNYANFQFAAWLMFFTIAFFYVLWQKTASRELKLREENLSYKYRNLKAQVNPHFLFNNLNTLSEIVHEDAARADHFIRELSGIYRYILENEENDLVPLSQELDFIRRYFDLQKERDGDKIEMSIDFPGKDKFRIVPVSLQILVENALKHNAISEQKPLRISITRENDSHIIVSNSIQKKNVLPQSHRTGLSNLSERVKMVTGNEIEVRESKDEFVVKLPLINA
jgi:two-component system LytT family sensor kinase